MSSHTGSDLARAVRWSGAPAWRHLRIGLAVIGFTLSLPSCFIARSAGANFATGAVERLGQQDSALVGLQRSLADSAGTFLAQEFTVAVLEPARATWSEMRQGVRDEVESASISINELIRVNLQEALPESIERNADLLEVRSQALARVFAEEFARALGEGVAEQLEPAAETLMRGVVRSAAEGVEADLRPAMHSLMLDLRDSLQVRIGDVDRAIAESRTVSGFRYAMYGAVSVLLLALAALGVSDRRRRGRALGALIDAIEQEGHSGTKRAAAACAREVGVHSWLGERVRSRTADTRQQPVESNCTTTKG